MEMIFTLKEIDKVVQWFCSNTKGYKCFAFHGEMGAGKTTFINNLCISLGVKSSMGSPTFSIINEYKTENASIFHMDLYRLKDENEAIAAGVEDCFYSDCYCFVEWPEKASGIFPENTIHCYLSLVNAETRILKLIV
jgi:tRNA threonylcarbamoyladenosine biosynthesis protein TsaE